MPDGTFISNLPCAPFAGWYKIQTVWTYNLGHVYQLTNDSAIDGVYLDNAGHSEVCLETVLQLSTEDLKLMVRTSGSLNEGQRLGDESS